MAQKTSRSTESPHRNQLKNKRGGARKGAGRKLSPILHKRINVYLAVTDINKLKQIDPHVSQAIRKLIQASK